MRESLVLLEASSHSVQKIKMSACWMFMILMGYRLFHAAQSQSSCTCNDQLETVCIPAGHNVTVPCPKLIGEDVTFNLLKDQEVIYNYTSGDEKNSPNYKPAYTRVGMELHENKENNTVSFMLTGVNVSRHGIYRCEGIVMFPPPFIKVQSASRILVLVEGHQCKDNKNCVNPKTDENQNSIFRWIGMLVVLSIYCIIVTIFALVNWVNQRKTDSQSDYMNTKPRAPKDRKKKRGVQNPIPRHF
ncbi:T-cell-specific surface glycoprotein CD28 [Enoplosus armatus]|uniref:T-cell-specific surface glycoprotein CD28 n=1 Tax=Enoplosus armatus TaxID=215367 RepID=UPI0039920FFD